MTLLDILQSQRKEILDEALGGIQRTHLPGYLQAGPELTLARLDCLLTLVGHAVSLHDLGPMLSHAESVAYERFHGGYDLSEVQTAFNVLEEVLWKRVVHQVPAAEQAQALGLVSTILGSGKESLARAYVSLASHARVPTLNVESLFKGASST